MGSITGVFFGLAIYGIGFLLFIALIVVVIVKLAGRSKEPQTENAFKKNMRSLFLYFTVSLALIIFVVQTILLFQNAINLFFPVDNYINENHYIVQMITSGTGMLVSGFMMLYFGLQIKKLK